MDIHQTLNKAPHLKGLRQSTLLYVISWLNVGAWNQGLGLLPCFHHLVVVILWTNYIHKMEKIIVPVTWDCCED